MNERPLQIDYRPGKRIQLHLDDMVVATMAEASPTDYSVAKVLAVAPVTLEALRQVLYLLHDNRAHEARIVATKALLAIDGPNNGETPR